MCYKNKKERNSANHHVGVQVLSGNPITMKWKTEVSKTYIVTPRSPRRSPKLMLRIPLATASRKTPIQGYSTCFKRNHDHWCKEKA